MADTSFFNADPEVKYKSDSIELHYEQGKSPVRIEYHDKDDYFNEQIRDLLFILHLPAPSEKKTKMIEQLVQFENLILLKIQREELSDEDDIWEFLDVFEAHIANQFDGMIHTDDEIFYDKKLKKIYKL